MKIKGKFSSCVLMAVMVAGAAWGGELPESFSAPEESFPASEALEVHAATVERRAEDGITVAEGAVDITFRDLRFRADRVVLHEETKDLVADGNVILDDGPDRFQGEHLELNLETQIGFIENAQGFAQSYYFTGERIEKLGEGRYRIRGASLTTCEGSRPDWKFRSRSASLHIDNYLTTWHPSLWVKRLPVFYLPYAVFPVKRDRSTGFLVPELQINEVEGWVIKNAFFWAPRENFDATLSLDYYRNLGFGQGLETRYIISAGTSGQLDGYYIKSRDTETERWNVDFNHLQALPYDIKGRAKVNVQSDRSFGRSFGENLEERSLEKTTSNFSLARRWSAYNLVVSGQFQESLVSEEETSITRFPEVTLDRSPNRFLGTGLFWKLFVEGVKLESKKTEERPVMEEQVESDIPQDGTETVLESVVTELRTVRWYIAPEISWPYALGGWGSVTPALGYREAYYSRGLDGEALDRGGPHYRLSLEGPRLYRVFDAGGGPGQVEKFKHLIEPRVKYLYTPEVDQENVPRFDSLDSISSANRIEYSLTNTLLGKISLEEAGESTGGSGEKEAPPATRYRTKTFMRVKLFQSYDFEPEDREGEGRVSPLEWEASTYPTGTLDIIWKGNYDFDAHGVGFQNLALIWRPGAKTVFRGEWRTAKTGAPDFIDLETSFFLWNLGLEGRSRYNLDDEEFIENRGAVKYLSQCWEVRVEYIRWPDMYEYRFQVSLKGLGTILTN